MSYGAMVQILGAAWNVVKVKGTRHSLLVVSKDSKGEGEGDGKWTKNGRQGKGGEGAFFFIPPKNPVPIFFNYIPKKKGNPFLDSS